MENMENIEDRKNWKIGYVNIAKAVIQLQNSENEDDIPYFLNSMFIDRKGLMGEFREFENKVIETSKDILNEELMLQKQQENATK